MQQLNLTVTLAGACYRNGGWQVEHWKAFPGQEEERSLLQAERGTKEGPHLPATT